MIKLPYSVNHQTTQFCLSSTAFTQGVRQRMLLGWLWTRSLPLSAILISQAGVYTGSNKENVERTLLLWWIYLFIKFINQWFQCVIVISICTCNGVYVKCETDSTSHNLPKLHDLWSAHTSGCTPFRYATSCSQSCMKICSICHFLTIFLPVNWLILFPRTLILLLVKVFFFFHDRSQQLFINISKSTELMLQIDDEETERLLLDDLCESDESVEPDYDLMINCPIES